MKFEIKEIVEERVRKYPVKPLSILGGEYNLYVFFAEEDLNLFDGFLLAEVKDKSELNYFKSKYQAPASGYAIRLSFVFYNSQLLIKDNRRNKYIQKDLSKISPVFLRRLRKVLFEPTEENISQIFDRDNII